jgi:hypothetical protein
MIPEKEIRDIQAYLRGTLPKIRKEKFESRLQTDTDFRIKFEEMKPIIETLSDLQTEQKIRELIELRKNEKIDDIQPTKKIQFLYSKTLKYAAAACVILFLGIIWYDSTSHIRLYDEYYTPENAFRSNSMSGCPDESKLNLYYKKEYTEFLASIEKEPKTLCIYYYEALGSLELNNPEKAQTLFLKSINAQDNYIKQSSEWYLALTYLKKNEDQKSINILQKIINSNGHQYETMAKTLLDELNAKPVLFRIKM